MRSEAEIKIHHAELMDESSKIALQEKELFGQVGLDHMKESLHLRQRTLMAQIALLHWVLEPEGYVRPDPKVTTQAGI